MDDADFSNVEIAQGHARKALRFGPVETADELAQHLEPEQMIVVAQKAIEKKELRERIEQEEKLRAGEQSNEVRAQMATTPEDEMVPPWVIGRRVTILDVDGHGVDDGLDVLFPVVDRFEFHRHLDEFLDVETRSVAQRTPEHARHIEAQSHEEKNERRPLIVFQHA